MNRDRQPAFCAVTTCDVVPISIAFTHGVAVPRIG